MLPLRLRLNLLADGFLASKKQKRDAYKRAFETLVAHGDHSVDVLLDRLNGSRRYDTKRTIRLAIKNVIAGQHVVVSTLGPAS